MSTEQTQVAKLPIAIGNRGIILGDLDSLWRFSAYIAKSGLAPKSIPSQEGICIAIQMGLEVGLTPMAALQNIAVINGRPSIWGDAQLGLVRATGELEEFREWYEAAGKPLPRNPSAFTDDVTAVCRVKRRGYDAVETGFSVADAKTAKLWGKEGPWTQYPARMLLNRARSFNLRDNFGDALKGLRSAEEAQDMPAERNVTGTAETVDQFVPPKRVDGPKSGTADASYVYAATTTSHAAKQSGPAPAKINGDAIAAIQAVLDERSASLADFAEVLIGDGAVAPEICNSLAALSELAPGIIERYAADGCAETRRGIDFVLEQRKA